jgi:hypothetical protein
MAEKVTKEDLWVKLNDTDKLLEKVSTELKFLELGQTQTGIKPDFSEIKEIQHNCYY